MGPALAVASMRCLEQNIHELTVLAGSAPLLTVGVKDESRDRDRDSLAESLALSDETGHCSSFTSLDTLDLDQSIDGGPMTLVDQTKGGGSGQSLDAAPSSLPPIVNDGTADATVFRRQRWETKSMTNLERGAPVSDKVNVSVGGWSESKAAAVPEGGVVSGAVGPVHKGSFVRKRDLWEKRASITSQSSSTGAVVPTVPASAPIQQRQKHTPDLVMDLPPSIPLSSSPKQGEGVVDPAPSRSRHESEGSSSSSNSSSPGSPDMTTAAETFAMQNQSTLKKSTIKAIKKDRAEAAAARTEAVAAGSVSPSGPGSTLVAPAESTPKPSIKVSVSAYGSSPLPPISSSGVRAVTPKLVNRFPHQYGTPCPVLPVAFANEAASALSSDPSRPQVKIKPQVLKKPTLPTSLNDQHNSQV